MNEQFTTSGWEQKTLEKLALATLREQKSRRRWGIFFRLLFFSAVFAVIYLAWPSSDLTAANRNKKHIALIAIDGVIAASNPASADNVIDALKTAFKDRTTKSVILSIDSPGGSPVQASQIYNEVRYLRTQRKNVRVYAVCSDLCASAAYYIAASADYIYADPSSLVGSIGVLLDGFGFADTLHKVGVERRLYTSGNHKSFLDPFSPVKAEDQHFAQGMLDDVHHQFIQRVQEGRGDRLKNDPNLFSGLVWTGNQALPLGLIDGFGDVTSVSRDVIKLEDIVDYTNKPSFIDQLSGSLGMEFAHSFTGQLNNNLAHLKEAINLA